MNQQERVHPHDSSDPRVPRSMLSKCKRRLRQVSLFTFVQIGGFVLIIGAVYAQSYNGRQQVVVSSRAGCERGAQNLVATVNSLRADQVGNDAVATDPRQPAATRAARRAEARTENDSLAILDSHIDRGVWTELKDPRDRSIVRDGAMIRTRLGARRLPPFRCNTAYPKTSPFLLVR